MKLTELKPATQKPPSGFSLALSAYILWGTSFLASKYTLEVMSPSVATSVRFILALVLMGLFFPLFGYPIALPRGWRSLACVVSVGLVGFGLLYPLQLIGLKGITSGLSAAIMLTSPLFVILAGAFILREKISNRKIGAVVLGLAGGVILLTASGSMSSVLNLDFVFPSVLTLAASLCLALSVILTRFFKSPLNPQTLTFWSMLVGLLVIIPFAFRSHERSHPVGSPGNHASLCSDVLSFIRLFCVLFPNLE